MTDLAAPAVIPPIPALPEFPDEAVPPPLSQVLRASTESAHKELELRLALPGSIRSLSDYKACLLRFYQLYRPAEIQFQHFSEIAGQGYVRWCSRIDCKAGIEFTFLDPSCRASLTEAIVSASPRSFIPGS